MKGSWMPSKRLKPIALSVAFVLASLVALGQGCDCPAISACGTCSGGLTQLTLRFDGASSALVAVSDQLGEVFSGIVASGQSFTFGGSISNDKFVGPTISITVDGVPHVSISSLCGSTLVGSVFGSFTVMAGLSKTGGALCCSAAAMEDVPPVISNCPPNITLSLPAASCTVSFSWTPPDADDNCTLDTLVTTHEPGFDFPPGDNLVVYTAIDIYGNSSACSFTVKVEDNTAPVITGCPSNILTVANANCEAFVSWTEPLATDNCSAVLTSSHQPGDPFQFGITPVTYTATDPDGNTATCTFSVVVENGNDPEITGCPDDILLYADENGEVVVPWTEPQALVSCGETTMTRSHIPGSPFAIGTASVVYEFTDETGKSSTCTFDVTVQQSEIEFTVSKVVTPDGDGVHDTWKLENIENFESNTVLIVDRWGNKIYQAAGYDNEDVFWDGTNGSGTKVPTGTYFYTVEVRFQGSTVKKKGFLEVIQ